MDLSNLVEWGLYLGLAVFVFTSITGLDDVIANRASGLPTKKDLALKIKELEERIVELESSHKPS